MLATYTNSFGIDTPSIDVKIDNNYSYVDNVLQVRPIKIQKLTVEGNDMIINGGIGFYTNALLNSSKMQFSGNPAEVSLIYEDGRSLTITGNDIQINSEKSNMLLRQPKIVSNGINNFKNFYAYGDLSRDFKTIREDIKIEGPITFNIMYSDVFTFARGMINEGNLLDAKPNYSVDKFYTLANFINVSFLPYLIPLATIFLIVNLFHIYRKKK